MTQPLPHSLEKGVIRVAMADCVLQGLQSHEISEGLLHLINNNERPRILVNLADIEQMTSITLAGFLQAHHRAAQRAGQVRLCCAGKTVRDVLHITMLDQVLHLHEDEASALAKFPAG